MVDTGLITPVIALGAIIVGQAYSAKTVRGQEKNITPINLYIPIRIFVLRTLEKILVEDDE
ncbi:MAG: hypothetical protein V3S69_06510 [Dehalococcoidales bacterium]